MSESAGDKGTIAIGLVHEALLVARQRRLDVSAVLREARIGDELLAAPRARVPAGDYARLWAALADAMDDEFFGMDRHPMRRGSYRLLCHAVVGCRDLGHALHRMLGFLRAVLDDLHGELRVDGEHAVLTLRDREGPNRMFAYATWLMLVHGLACWLVRRRIPLLAARFRCPMPGDVGDYLTRFCDAATFDAPVTEVRFDARLLGLKLVETDAGVRAFLRDAPGNLLVKYRNDGSIVALIRRRLRTEPPDEWPAQDALAGWLGISTTTLQRRLLVEGSSYRQIKDELRRDVAIDLLANTTLPVAEIAARVGFRETSAYHRAFKKWTGVSPGVYRRAEATGRDGDARG